MHQFPGYPEEGGIWLEGGRKSTIAKKELYEYRQQVGMIFQDFNLFDHLTALENITIALVRVKGMSKKEARERAVAELERVGSGSTSINIRPSFRAGRNRESPLPGPWPWTPRSCSSMSPPLPWIRN